VILIDRGRKIDGLSEILQVVSENVLLEVAGDKKLLKLAHYVD